MIYLRPQRRGSRKKAEMTDLQKHIEIMRRLCRKLDETGLGLKRRSNGKLDTLVSFETDVLLFMIALSNGDGQIDEDETLAISENLGLKLSESQIHRFVERQNLSDYRLQDADIPLTMQVLVDADTEIMQREISYLEEYRQLMQDHKAQAERMQDNLLAVYERLQALLNRGDVTAAKAFIESQEQLLGTVSIRAYCRSPIVNAAISLYLRRADEQGIAVRQKVNLPKELATDENDLAVLLSNLLENAIQACAGCPRPELSLILQHNGRQCVLEIVNTCTRKLQLTEEGLPETKHKQAGHGIGTLSLKNFLLKYDGYVDFSQENGQVRLFIYWEGGK